MYAPVEILIGFCPRTSPIGVYLRLLKSKTSVLSLPLRASVISAGNGFCDRLLRRARHLLS
jgi:hypothetical protein